MEIEESEYIRTKRGSIGQCIGIFNGHVKAKYHIQFQDGVKVKRQWLSTKTIEKHSKNITDLIEVRDVCILDNNYCLFIIDEQTKKLLKNHFIWKELKILTHQSFENNCYKEVE